MCCPWLEGVGLSTVCIHVLSVHVQFTRGRSEKCVAASQYVCLYALIRGPMCVIYRMFHQVIIQEDGSEDLPFGMLDFGCLWLWT